jgi:pyridoxal 5'-phosphate synthase pdxS subunit
MIRTKGEAGSGNIVEAVRHMRAVQGAIKRLTILGISFAALSRNGL